MCSRLFVKVGCEVSDIELESFFSTQGKIVANIGLFHWKDSTQSQTRGRFGAD